MKISVLCFLLHTASFNCFAQAPASPFDKWDADKDGQLSKSELPEGLRKNFERVDGDKDGSISRKEDADFRKNARGRKAGVPGVKKNEDLDYSGNGNPRQLLDLYLPESAAAADGKKAALNLLDPWGRMAKR